PAGRHERLLPPGGPVRVRPARPGLVPDRGGRRPDPADRAGRPVLRGVTMRALAAELFGTFCLVFAGTGAVVVNDTHGGAVTHVGVALTFGLVVLAMIYTVGDVSGCHLNPAVTVGFAATGRFAMARVVPYLLAQCAGAGLASGVLRLMFPGHPTL